MSHPINMRKFEVEDDSVTEAKLANAAVTASKLAAGAVDLTSSVVTGSLPASKSDKELTVNPLLGDETEVSVTGTTEVEKKFANFIKSQANIKNLGKMVIAVEMKTSDALNTASLLVYLDAEGTPRLTLTSVSTAYEVKIGEANLADLANGVHKVSLRLKSDNAVKTASLRLTELHFKAA